MRAVMALLRFRARSDQAEAAVLLPVRLWKAAMLISFWYRMELRSTGMMFLVLMERRGK
jgi:hypothetical protein